MLIFPLPFAYIFNFITCLLLECMPFTAFLHPHSIRQHNGKILSYICPMLTGGMRSYSVMNNTQTQYSCDLTIATSSLHIGISSPFCSALVQSRRNTCATIFTMWVTCVLLIRQHNDIILCNTSPMLTGEMQIISQN